MTDLFKGYDTVGAIRRKFCDLKPDERGMLEIVNARFIADEPAIFGTPNEDWHKRELAWYLSQSRVVDTIPPPIPKIWEDVASVDGWINSNYGWCVFSHENGRQYARAIESLKGDLYSRQAVMIYTRPSMHEDWNFGGMRDFICTNTVQLLARGGELHYIVQMRSSDAVFGYKGDYAWHTYVHELACKDMGIPRGQIIWNAGSLHVYPRHIHLVQSAWEALWS